MIDSKDELYEFFSPSNSSKPEIHGGFARIHWDRNAHWEEQLKNDLKVTVRCIPEGESEPYLSFQWRFKPRSSGRC